MFHVGPLGPENGPKRPVLGGRGGKSNRRLRRTEISVVLPLGIIQIDEKRPRFGPFFAENQFSPADELVLMGLVVRKSHFDVTACAAARRLDDTCDDDNASYIC